MKTLLRIKWRLEGNYALEIALLVSALVLLTQLGMVSRKSGMDDPGRGKVSSASSYTISEFVPRPDLDRKLAADRLVEAIIQVESGGHAHKVGRAGERGIMQIKKSTWRETTRQMYGRSMSFDGAFNSNLNRKVGKYYLAALQAFLQQHRGKWKADERALLLACYNAGPARVRRAGFDLKKLPRTTQSYVARATALHDYLLAEQAPLLQKHLLAGETKSGSGKSS